MGNIRPWRRLANGPGGAAQRPGSDPGRPGKTGPCREVVARKTRVSGIRSLRLGTTGAGPYGGAPRRRWLRSFRRAIRRLGAAIARVYMLRLGSYIRCVPAKIIG